MRATASPLVEWARATRVGTALRDVGRRNIVFSALAVPGHLAMAASKIVLLVISPSLFLLGGVAFTVGMAAIKLLVVLTDRRMARGSVVAPHRPYRDAGLIVVTLSLVYIACCIPFFLGERHHDPVEQPVAIALAALTFTELGLSIHGLVVSRRRRDPLMEAVKLSNLAAALLLLVLTQAALLSFSAPDEPALALYNGISGVVFGTAAAAIGGVLLVRARRVRG